MSDEFIKLNRQQLAEFLPNQYAIRAFEQLFEQVQVALPDSIDTNETVSSQAVQQAGEALASLAYVADQLARLLLAPVQEAAQTDFFSAALQDSTQADLFIPPVALGNAAEKSYDRFVFTPTLTFGGASVGMTYSQQNGYGVKFGNIVYFVANIRLTAKGASVGVAKLNGLPVAQKTLTDGEAVIDVQGNNMAATATTQLIASMTSGASTIDLLKFTAGASTSMTDAEFNNNTVLRTSGFYFTE